MNKNVVIRIEAIQRYPGQKPEKTVTEAEAEYFLRAGSHYVIFEESQEGFTEKIKSMLKIKNNSVELTKKGLIHSHMFFEEEVTFASEYKTPFGSFMLDMNTKKLEVKETPTEIEVEIVYSLETRELAVADCNIRIMIKEKQSEG